MLKAQNRVIFAKDLRRGMVVLPFKGTYYQIALDGLDWAYALHSEWWQHVVTATDGDKITLARPYAYAREHFDTRGALVGTEVYSVDANGSTPYMLIRENFTT